MKKKLVLAILFASAFSITTTAQIENEIKNYVDSTEILLNNGRKFLAKSIREGKIQKSQEVFHYLMMKGEERNCSSFSFKEQLLLNIVFNNWDEALTQMANYNEDRDFLCYRNPEPIEEAIYAEFRRKTPSIDKISENLSFASEDIDVLKLLIHILEFGSKNDAYDVMIQSFRKKYPNSKYNNFVINYLPAARTKVSMSFSIGPKFGMFTGNISEYFKSNTGIAVSMDFCISKVYVSMYLEGGGMKLMKPLTLTQSNGDTYNFKVGDRFNRFDVGFKTGYYVVRNNKFHIAPYATLLAGGYMESNLYEFESNNNQEFEVYNSFTPGLGVNFEFKLGSIKSKPYPNPMLSYMMFSPMVVDSYFSLKLDAGVTSIPKYYESGRLANGMLSYITLGVVWGIGEF